ncbi:DegT/DnrJ/EryC1/StrS family aminotransferase [Bordetella holmesii]|uniref:DegT/DnrJ/EryC1/StrS aminotransferase family protein n=1 Tax=Bordetella holmesii CDC-H585-BH TaxID=1331206 RepID=A0A158M4C1_9BORD|nr:DegT/DnrJ/EryC1/StrS family aminotransferase [Bordetella holmesii]AIT26537.1 degT/DnrJ/EryC1/StrS aminotransferase family protein [Bordetella holmesii 44057]EWM42324.1 degT/DnrJ/EryC1/StrS aminotransferase family protein [Bordetella holmesii 41130]EWM47115.1 degT/DnrJ/EryC1/StrS aminotransferase family protein [Bordetella holmesii 35009]AMD45532.1 aminotransferase [Bordetella holmesii H558]AOB34420.1 aminotransferase [Bordetella holmesii]
MSWPVYAADEIAAVADVLRRGQGNAWSGADVAAFEQDYARQVGRPYAVALSNGTVALELALRALEIGPGDDVLVTARSFVASASAIVAVGARPVFADVDPDSQNVTAQTLEAARTPCTRAAVLVHLAGWMCEMDEILTWAGRHGIRTLEDCAQAHGASYRGAPAGSLGDAAAWSFCQDKIISTGGEGGMVTTASQAVWQRVWSLKDHGKLPIQAASAGPGFKWLHEAFGSNARMTAMQAAIGRIQLRKCAAWVARRREHAQRLLDAAARYPALRVPRPPEHIGHAYYRCYVFVRPHALRPGWSRDGLLRALQAGGVRVFQGSCPEIYREVAFRRAGLAPRAPLPVARELGLCSVAFPVDPGLTEAEAGHRLQVLDSVMARASR